MNRTSPSIVLLVLYVLFLGSLVLSASSLPDHVASHFGGNGQPNGWMNGSEYLRFVLLFGTATPLFIVGISYAIRFFPARMINLPRKEYWLAPERRSETYEFFFRHSLWSACMILAFIMGIHGLVVYANLQAPPILPTPAILTLIGTFVAGMVAWSVVLIVHFRNVR